MTTLFQCLFLRCLPADLRVLLAHVDHSNLKELARKADELWSPKPRQDVLAVIHPEEAEEEQETITAVSTAAPRGGGSGYKRGCNKHQYSGRGRGRHKQLMDGT